VVISHKRGEEEKKLKKKKRKCQKILSHIFSSHTPKNPNILISLFFTRPTATHKIKKTLSANLTHTKKDMIVLSPKLTTHIKSEPKTH
jgi:hypothetical protein